MTQSTDSRLKRFFVKDGKLHPGWRSLLYLPAWLLAVGLGQLPALMVYAGYLAARQPDAAAVTGGLLDIANWPLLVGIGFFLGQILTLLLVTFIFLHFLDRRPFASFGFGLGRGWWGESGLGLALGVGMIAGIFGVEWVTGLVALDGLRLGSELGVPGLLFLIGFLAYFILQGSSEEIPLRGYLLQSLNEWLGPVGATLITAVGFSLLHIFNFRVASPFNLLALFNIALFGVVAAYAYFVTGRLWLPAALHAAWNFGLGPVVSLPVSGIPYRGLLRTTVSNGGRILTGGDFGPEGGVLATIALLAGWAVIWLWQRRRQGQGKGKPREKADTG